MLVGLAAFATALVLGTFLEYWIHRAMHSWLLKKKHALHHRDGWGQGWLGEFWDYFIGTLPIQAAGFLVSVEAGIGFAAGSLFYCTMAAYSHQLQHEHPELCFWLRRPVHFLHHHNHMWHYNFGISISFWDHVFGTYKAGDWTPPPPERHRLRSYLQIKWF